MSNKETSKDWIIADPDMEDFPENAEWEYRIYDEWKIMDFDPSLTKLDIRLGHFVYRYRIGKKPRREFDIKAGDMVLYRDGNSDIWMLNLFGYIRTRWDEFLFNVAGAYYSQIVKADTQEIRDLAGTTDPIHGQWTEEDFKDGE